MGLIGRNEIPEPDTVGDWLRRMGDPSTISSRIENCLVKSILMILGD